MASAKTQVARYFFWLMTVAVMVMIFLLSSENAEISSANSEGFISNLLNIVSKKFKDLSDEEKLSFIEAIHSSVRKFAHAGIYFALGFSMFSAMCTYKTGWGVKYGVTLPSCLIYAASDEYHQTFVQGRSGQLEDILIDFIGAFAGVIFVFICVVIYGAIKNGGGKMRKKELMKKLSELVTALDALSEENKELKCEIKTLREELEAKKTENTSNDDCCCDNDTDFAAEESLADTPTEACFVVKTVDEIDFGESENEEALKDDMLEYGAEIIGKITVEAARCCDIITAAHGPDVKDQLSLIMGKSEVAKGEILAIALSDFPCDKKREMIAAELDDAKLYFKSVCEQNKEI